MPALAGGPPERHPVKRCLSKLLAKAVYTERLRYRRGSRSVEKSCFDVLKGVEGCSKVAVRG
jgi:hypothetical protein